MSDLLPAPTVTTATHAEKPVIGRLLQLYLHDFSGLAGAAGPNGLIGDDGVFSYEHFDSYWEDADREALLFRVGHRLVGFALVNGWSASGMEMDRGIAEFFVLRKYRRTGPGTHAASEIVRRDRAVREIAVADYNPPAQGFWRAAAPSMTGYTYRKIEGDGQRWSGPIWRLEPG